MSTGTGNTTIESPFAVKSDVAQPAQAPQGQKSANTIGTFRYSMLLALVKGSLSKVGALVDDGIEDEDLSVNEDGTYDDEFDAATVDALAEAEVEAQRLLLALAKFRTLIQGRMQEMGS